MYKCKKKKVIFWLARIPLSSIETVILILISPKKETMLQALFCNPKIVKAYLNQSKSKNKYAMISRIKYLLHIKNWGQWGSY